LLFFYQFKLIFYIHLVYNGEQNYHDAENYLANGNPTYEKFSRDTYSIAVLHLHNLSEIKSMETKRKNPTIEITIIPIYISI